MKNLVRLVEGLRDLDYPDEVIHTLIIDYFDMPDTNSFELGEYTFEVFDERELESIAFDYAEKLFYDYFEKIEEQVKQLNSPVINKMLDLITTESGTEIILQNLDDDEIFDSTGRKELLRTGDYYIFKRVEI